MINYIIYILYLTFIFDPIFFSNNSIRLQNTIVLLIEHGKKKKKGVYISTHAPLHFFPFTRKKNIRIALIQVHYK